MNTQNTILTWRPAPVDLIRLAARHDYSGGDQPDLTGYLLAIQGEHDGIPYSRRALASLMGWGSSRAARIIDRARRDHRSWAAGRSLGEPLRYHNRAKASTQVSQPAKVEPAVSAPGEPQVSQSEYTGEPPSRARSFLDRDRTETPTNAPAGAGIQEPTHEQSADPRGTAGMERPTLRDRSEVGEHQDRPAEAAPERDVGDSRRVEPGGTDPEVRDVSTTQAWEALTAAVAASPKAWKLTAARKRVLNARIAEHGVDAVLLVAAWAKSSCHDRADLLRKRGDVFTLIRPSNFDNYLAFATTEEGSQDGSHQPSFNGYLVQPEKALDYAIRYIQRHGTDFEAWHEDPRTAEALRKAAGAIGGRHEIGKLDTWRRREVEGRYLDVYETAWAGGSA